MATTSSVSGTTSVSGLISGLDTNSIISKMMALEQRPIVLLQQQEAAYQAKISALGTLKGVLTDVQTATTALADPTLFAGLSASSSNTSVLTASVSSSSTAVASTYQMTVSALAQAQQVKSAAFTSSSAVVGTGTLTIQVGTNTAVNVTIDSTNNTLSGIAQAINNAKTDVTAGVIYDGTSYYLTLASNKTGASNTISLTMADSDGVNTDAAGLSSLYATPATQSMSQTQAAADAQLNVNGITVTRSSNTITDLLQGVTLTLNKADAANSLTVSVSQDVSSVSNKVQAFVDKYNQAMTTLSQLQASNTTTNQIGALAGDSTARILQGRLQNLLTATVGGVASSVNNLSVLGVTADKDGKLSFDSTVFAAAYKANQTDVKNFFTQTTTGQEGIAVQFNSLMDSYLQTSTGVLTAKVDGLNSSVTGIEDQISNMQTLLAQREDTLRQQFNTMESLLAQFQATSGTLTQQLQSLSNLNAQIASNNSSSTK